MFKDCLVYFYCVESMFDKDQFRIYRFADGILELSLILFVYVQTMFDYIDLLQCFIALFMFHLLLLFVLFDFV